jgi:hypothetical protein
MAVDNITLAWETMNKNYEWRVEILAVKLTKPSVVTNCLLMFRGIAICVSPFFLRHIQYAVSHIPSTALARHASRAP